MPDRTHQLASLWQMHQAGLLTEEQFEAEKARLLADDRERPRDRLFRALTSDPRASSDPTSRLLLGAGVVLVLALVASAVAMSGISALGDARTPVTESP